jgi:hypothetical protein
MNSWIAKPARQMKFFFAVVVSVTAVCRCAVEAAPALHINLIAPLDFQVVQRSRLDTARVMVVGSIAAAPGDTPISYTLEMRVMGTLTSQALPQEWRPLPYDSRTGAFRDDFNLPAGGWYRMEVRALHQGTQIASAAVEHVGVGEVFVVAGQSNSANYGEEKQNTTSGLVAAFDGTKWQLANDPEPGATGKKGSFMPLFGDEMAEHFHVPIGIVATGVGATSVREWLPAGTRLTRLPPLTRNVVTNSEGQWEVSGKIFQNFTTRMTQLGTNGFRAVLWHQGESDANQMDPDRTLPGRLYVQNLEQLIRDSSRAIGWTPSWFVAQVSYHPTNSVSPDIRDAQTTVCKSGLAVPGPDTDTLTGDMREKDGTGIHFSAKGLKAHAHLWFEKVSPWLERQLDEAGK